MSSGVGDSLFPPESFKGIVSFFAAVFDIRFGFLANIPRADPTHRSSFSFSQMETTRIDQI